MSRYQQKANRKLRNSGRERAPWHHVSHCQEPSPAAACGRAGAFPQEIKVITERKIFVGDSEFLSFQEQDDLLAGGNLSPISTHPWSISSERSRFQQVGTRCPTCGFPALLVLPISCSHGQLLGERPAFLQGKCCVPLHGSEHLLLVTLEVTVAPSELHN